MPVVIDLHEGVAAIFDEAQGAGRSRWRVDVEGSATSGLPTRRWLLALPPEEFDPTWLAVEAARLSEPEARRVEDQRRQPKPPRDQRVYSREYRRARRDDTKRCLRKIDAMLRARRAQRVYPPSTIDWKALEAAAKKL